MSMLDSLRSKLGIDPEADSYVDDTEENVFPGGQGAAAAQEYTQQQEIKQHSNKVVNINATTQLQVVLVKPERFDDASSIADPPLIRKRRLRQRVITAIYIKYYLLFWQSCQYKRRIFVTIVCHPPNLCPAR